jgi:hypothetical protein
MNIVPGVGGNLCSSGLSRLEPEEFIFEIAAALAGSDRPPSKGL